MRIKSVIPLAIIFNLLLISQGFTSVKNVNPGAYENWGRMINRLDILRSFKITDYSQFIIRDIDTANVQYQLDGFSEEVKKNLLKQGNRILINRIKNNPQHLEMIEGQNGSSGKALILKISILEIGVKPGSIWWNPMAWVDIQGELLAPQNNEVFLKFKTTRTSSVQGVPGGTVIKGLDEEGKKLVISAIEKDFKEIGDDLNELILSFK
ncbi:MAG: hypothetical protein HY892_06705 [Deltaproteobacteria bacterium]|nr:hypothetical protein [Deltaproteobacteria bacterium]